MPPDIKSVGERGRIHRRKERGKVRRGWGGAAFFGEKNGVRTQGGKARGRESMGARGKGEVLPQPDGAGTLRKHHTKFKG